MEMLDIVNEQGEPTGEVIDRKSAHQQGVRHRTAHVWIVRFYQGRPQILLQKRSDEKDSHPGCYDISSAGHIPAGNDYAESAVRELEEELGLCVQPEKLIECGARHITYHAMFHDREFIDNQYSKVYILWCDCSIESLKLQKEEVSSVMWMDFEECYKAVEKNTIPHCIQLEELDMLKKEIYRQR